MLTVRELILMALLLCLLLIPLFPGVFLRGEEISPADLLFLSQPWSHYAPADWHQAKNPLMPDVITAFHPYYVLCQEAIRRGEWPLWNPLELAGIPLLANCQTAALYPPRLLHAFLDVNRATTLYILFKLWMCGMTAYICGRGLRLGIPAARFLAVGWMLASYNVIWCNWSLPDVSAWLPILFLGVERVLEGRYRSGGYLMASGGTLLLLAGHPETAFAMSFGLGVYFVTRLVWERRRGRELWLPVGVCATAWGVALLVCAAQLLPFIEYLRNSETLSGRSTQDIQTYLSPGTSACFWIPRFYGTMAERNYWGDLDSNRYSVLYPGIAVWACAFLLVRRQTRAGAWRTRLASLWLASLVGIGLAFNAYPFDYLHALPVFRSMLRGYHVVFVLFSLPLVGAVGLEQWLSRPRRLNELVLPLGCILLVMLWLYALVCFNSGLIHTLRLEPYQVRQMVYAAIWTTLSLMLLALHCVWPRPRLWAAALTVLLALDLLNATRGLNPTLRAGDLFPRTELTAYLQGLGHPCRIGVGEGRVPSGILAAYAIEDWLGYDGLYPERIIRFQKSLGTDWWNAMEPACAMAYYLHDPRYGSNLPLTEPGRYEKVAALDGLEVYKNTHAFPRAYLVGKMKVIPEVSALLDAMKAPGYDPGQVLLTERAPNERLPAPADGPLAEVEIVKHASTRVELKVDARTNCFLVLADAYFPGWQATIDGNPTETFPAYYVFRGITVPAGQHRVEFRYRPWTFRLGLLISMLTMVAGCSVALRHLYDRRASAAV